MQLSGLLLRLWALLLAMTGTGLLVDGSPIVCSDLKRDLILKGELSPEECCSYGRCRGDVVIAMS